MGSTLQLGADQDSDRGLLWWGPLGAELGIGVEADIVTWVGRLALGN